MNLRTIYLLFAILGAVIPIAFFADFAVDQGIDLVAFVMALFVNGAAGGFTADLLISSFVFWIYMFSNQSDGPKPWVFIALNLCIGLSCALPAYLWSRTRPSRK
jgi:hypothetical protein